jgi:hypothetical protein
MHPLAEALLRPEAYPHSTGAEIQVVETHISWIFLTGRFAYKLKKPVNLGFLDFSTIELRHRYCLEELRLNRRLCPELYLDVLPVVAMGSSFRIGAEGPVIDYVVRMVQFDRSFELDRLLQADRLGIEEIDRIVELIVEFHTSAPPAPQDAPFGKPDVLIMPMLENFESLSRSGGSGWESEIAETIRSWTIEAHRRLIPVLRTRKEKGFIRECHGDMHTGNMVLWNGRIMIFDCIEFNSRLSVIDVMSDAAFLFMDLDHSGHKPLAWRFLNLYLSGTGDYEGLRLLRFYSVYRAMVRAKVTAIRCDQEGDANRKVAISEQHRTYLALALRYTTLKRPLLVITHGLSGSGKSMHSSQLSGLAGMVHIRSDVERKRLFGIGQLSRSADTGIDIYSSEATEKTYGVMINAARAAIEAGWPVIVDATFLKRTQREMFIMLAESLCCRCRILDFLAPVEVLKQRVSVRYEKADDASEADSRVLELQMRSDEALDEKERAIRVVADTGSPVDHEKLLAMLFS